MKQFAALIILGIAARLGAAEAADPGSALEKASSFAIGGVGVAGTMSAGEQALRDILKQADAVRRLETILPQASPAGQLYALLGLRGRDHEAYRRALARYGEREGRVETMRGCILGHESFTNLVKQIDHGDYDESLSREWPKR